MTSPMYRRGIGFLVALGALFAAFSGSASGAQITIGELAPSSALSYCKLGRVDTIPSGSAKLAYTVPTDGAITGWNTAASQITNPKLTFKLYRSTGAGSYQVVGWDGPRSLTPGIVSSFETSIPAKAGDIIGLDNEADFDVRTACEFETGNPADILEGNTGSAQLGQSFEPNQSQTGARLNVTAVLLRPPSVQSISPSTGSIGRPGFVSIHGTEFAHMQAVHFGQLATNFSVVSETEIVAAIPEINEILTLPITVSTDAGTATAATSFQYEACVVPRVTGMRLRQAKRLLIAADCRVAHTKKVKSGKRKGGQVVKQASHPGELRPTGFRVTLTISKNQHVHHKKKDAHHARTDPVGR